MTDRDERYTRLEVNPEQSAHAAARFYWAGTKGGPIENPKHRAAAEYIVNAALGRFGAPVLVQVDRLPALGQDVFRIWNTAAMDADNHDLREWIHSSLRQDLKDQFPAFEKRKSTVEVSLWPLTRPKVKEHGAEGNAAHVGVLGNPSPRDLLPKPDRQKATEDRSNLDSAPSLNEVMGYKVLPPDSVPENAPNWLLAAARDVQQRLMEQSDPPYRPDLNIRFDASTGQFTVNIGTWAYSDTRDEAEQIIFDVHSKLIAAGRDSQALWEFQINNFGRLGTGEFPFPRLATGHRDYIISPGHPVDDETEAALAAMLVAVAEKRLGAAPSTITIASGDNPPHTILTASPPKTGVDQAEFAAALPEIAAEIRDLFATPYDYARFVIRDESPTPTLRPPAPETKSKFELNTHNAVLHGELKEPQGVAPGYAENQDREGNPIRETEETPLPAVLETLIREYGQPKPAAVPRKTQVPDSEPHPVAEKPAPAPESTPEPELSGPIRGVSR